MFDKKRQNNIEWRKDNIINKMVLGNLDVHVQKNEIKHTVYHVTWT